MPAYLKLAAKGELADRVEEALAHLEDCDLCPRYCHVNRNRGVRGAVCQTGRLAVVYGFGPHLGEERPIRGKYGSGTIFFSSCNLRCIYCQNWEISHKRKGLKTDAHTLARTMLELQAMGCHNINLVTPSHVVAQILEAVLLAADEGLRLPLVYNTGGYDCMEALRLLDGVIDIYMPDMKYGDEETARRLSKVRDYVAVNRRAVIEMHRQVGDLLIDEDGLARRGLLIRHLVLPHGLAGSKAVLRFIANEISKDTYLNIMDQYHPCYRAWEDERLARPLLAEEFDEVIRYAQQLGLHRFESLTFAYRR